MSGNKPRVWDRVIFKHKEPDWEAPAIVCEVGTDWTCTLWVFGPQQLRKTGVREGDKPGEFRHLERPMATLGGG